MEIPRKPTLALGLVYSHGFAERRLVDIAAEAKVPPGNVYYYFKTKEDIGAAILEERLSQIKALEQKLDGMDSAQECLCAFVQIAGVQSFTVPFRS